MKPVFLALAFLACFFFVEAQIPILMKEHKVVGEDKDKNYRYLYQTANGIYQEEQGLIKNADDPGYETQVQQGQYQYVSPEGELIQVRYTADENGFVPTGSHIPTPPPVPKEIQKLLEFLATKKPSAEDSAYDDYDSPPPPRTHIRGQGTKSGNSKQEKQEKTDNRNKQKFESLELELPK